MDEGRHDYNTDCDNSAIFSRCCNSWNYIPRNILNHKHNWDMEDSEQDLQHSPTYAVPYMQYVVYTYVYTYSVKYVHAPDVHTYPYLVWTI